MTMMNPPPPRQPGGQIYPQATAARTGIIYQGAAPTSIATQATATSSSAAKVTFAPRYANAIMSMLKPPPLAAAVEENDSSTDKKKRRYGELLDQLVPPLFCQVTKRSSCDNANQDEGRDDKKRKADEEETNQSKSQNDNNKCSQSKAEYLASLKQQLESYKRENQRILSRRMSVYNSFVELHECYETGLDGIARANDLRNVPDNVMMDRPDAGKK